jgi:hypothetical protein
MATDRAPELPVLPRDEAGGHRTGERGVAARATPHGQPVELHGSRSEWS